MVVALCGMVYGNLNVSKSPVLMCWPVLMRQAPVGGGAGGGSVRVAGERRRIDTVAPVSGWGTASKCCCRRQYGTAHEPATTL